MSTSGFGLQKTKSLLSKNTKHTKNHGNVQKKFISKRLASSALFTFLPKQGSLTIEAAIVIPIFTFLLTTMLSFLFVMVAQTKLQNAMETVSQRMAVSYYAVEKLAGDESRDEEEENLLQGYFGDTILGLATEALLGQLVLSEMDYSWISYPIIENGIDGISFWGSGYEEDSDCIKICARYKISVPFFPGNTGKIVIGQQCVRRVWTGKSGVEEGEEDPWVYITAHGTVYHTQVNCTHIRLSIKTAMLSLIENLRNDSGGKYYACELCADQCGSQVLISASGDRYHATRDCAGLKREVTAIRLSEVGDRPLCQRCEKNQEEVGQ